MLDLVYLHENRQEDLDSVVEYKTMVGEYDSVSMNAVIKFFHYLL